MKASYSSSSRSARKREATALREDPKAIVTEDVAGEEARSPLELAGLAALAAAGVAWLVLLLGILRHTIFVTNDSLSDYAHVWYVSRQLWHHFRIPIHMPIIGHGQAFAFPYAFIPWLTAGLLRPIFGDWIVTLWLAVGAAGVIVASFWAFPEIRRGWWGACVLVSPVLVASLILGQLPFLWAAALLIVAIGLWRRDLYWPAVIVAGLAQATHAAVVLPLAGLLVLAWLRWEPDPRRLVTAYAISVVIALPAVYFVLASPVTSDASFSSVVVNFFGTLIERAGVVALPILLLALQRHRPRLAPAAFAGLLALNLVFAPVLQTGQAVHALNVSPDTSLMSFINSPDFHPGATYRILRIGDDKVGMYELIQHGAFLDSEFFPESMHQGSFVNADAYAAFLRQREVDNVIIYHNYDQVRATNEHQLLNKLIASPYGGVWAEHAMEADDFDVYVIHRARG